MQEEIWGFSELEPTQEQMRSMLRILCRSIQDSLEAMPDTPENQQAQHLLKTGLMAAAYHSVSHLMTEEEFLRKMSRL